MKVSLGPSCRLRSPRCPSAVATHCAHAPALSRQCSATPARLIGHQISVPRCQATHWAQGQGGSVWSLRGTPALAWSFFPHALCGVAAAEDISSTWCSRLGFLLPSFWPNARLRKAWLARSSQWQTSLTVAKALCHDAHGTWVRADGCRSCILWVLAQGHPGGAQQLGCASQQPQQTKQQLLGHAEGNVPHSWPGVGGQRPSAPPQASAELRSGRSLWETPRWPC